MPTFVIDTPPDYGRIVLLHSDTPVYGEEIVITPDYAPFGVAVGQLPDEQLKVSVTAEKVAKMRCGKYTAVVQNKSGGIVAIYRDAVRICNDDWVAVAGLLFSQEIPMALPTLGCTR